MYTYILNQTKLHLSQNSIEMNENKKKKKKGMKETNREIHETNGEKSIENKNELNCQQDIRQMKFRLWGVH